MRVKLYIPYYPEGAVVNDKNDMSDEDYANALLNNFGGGYSKYMDNVINSITDSRYGMVDVVPEKYQIKSVKDTSKVEYYLFDCELNNEEDKFMSEDEFNFYVNSGDMCAFFVHMILGGRDEVDADAVSELNFWLKDSRNIMLDSHIDDDHKVAMLPDKDLLIDITVTNNLITPSRYMLSGTRIIDQDNANNFAIIVNKIKNI